VGTSVLLYNVAFFVLRNSLGERPRFLKAFVFAQIGLDWLALIFLVYYTGGVESPVSLAFTFHLIIGAILLSRLSCYGLAVLAGAFLGVVTILEELGILIPPLTDHLPDLSGGLLSTGYMWLGLTCFFMVTAYLATSITSRLREREEALSHSERALDQAYHEMEALHQLGKVVNSSLDSKEVLGLIAESAAGLLGMRACFIRLFDRSGKRLYIGGSFGLSQAYLDKGPVELEKSRIDAETLSNGVVQSINVGDDPRFQYREEARREGLQSVLCVPLVAQNRSIGIIRVYSSAPHHFSDQETSLLRNLGNLGAIAIVNARSYADLERANEQRIWFARMTHHQLRTPLAAVRSTLDALPYAGSLESKQEELVERAKRRIQDAFDTIRDLLDLAAAQRPLEQLQTKPSVFDQAVARAVETAGERAHSKGIELLVRLPEEPVVLEAQAEDIDRIFVNLLENAVKYTPDGGRVVFSVELSEGRLRATISDNGIGISSEDQEKIFDGFYRTKEAKATGEIGTGLGLSIVKELVERWGGELLLSSELGRGSEFVVILPLSYSESF
jgi:signal transduction histidine kinase